MARKQKLSSLMSGPTQHSSSLHGGGVGQPQTTIHNWEKMLQICEIQGYINRTLFDANTEAIQRIITMTSHQSPNTFDINTITNCSAKGLAILTISYESQYTQHSDLIVHDLRNRLLLATFFFATGSRKWKFKNNWLVRGSHHCQWYGVYCNLDGDVIGLSLEDNFLVDELPDELWELSLLKKLSLKDNGLVMTLPPGLSKLTALEVLALGGNNVEGTIPTELAALSNLEILTLSTPASTLHGTIPTELGLLSSIRTLHLVSLDLTGEIPLAFASLRSLTDLRLEGNFNGNFYDDILLKYDSLESLHIGSALGYFEGTFPFERFFEKNSDLRELKIKYNGLEGTLPSNIGLLKRLEVLSIRHSQMNGTIPTELGLCTKLKYINFGVNHLTGTLPSELGMLSRLNFLAVFDNFLATTVPSELGLLSNIDEVIQLQQQQPAYENPLCYDTGCNLWVDGLVGTIPDALCNLKVPLVLTCNTPTYFSCDCCECDGI